MPKDKKREELVAKYRKAIKAFAQKAKMDSEDFTYHKAIYNLEYKRNKEALGDIALKLSSVTNSQLQARLNLFKLAAEEGDYLASMKAHANMFSSSKAPIASIASSLSEDSTDKENKPIGNIQRERKRRRIERQDLVNYRESSIWSDETIDPIKANSPESIERQNRYEAKMRKLVEDTPAEKRSGSRVSFPPNYVLLRQLEDVRDIHNGKKVLFYRGNKKQLKTVFRDVPGGTNKDGLVSVNIPDVKKKNPGITR
jgi:hypothetical protein